MPRILILCLLLLFASKLIQAQNQSTFFSHIETLCSKELHGRGAEFKGDSLAAAYISRKYKDYGLSKLGTGYYQPFLYDVNTFPGAYALSINGKSLKVGEEFIAHSGSKSGKGSFSCLRLSAENWGDANYRAQFFKNNLDNKVIIYDNSLNDTKTPDYFKLKLAKLKAAGLIELLDSDPIASELSDQIVKPTFQINKSILEKFGEIKTVEFNLDAVLVEDYKTQNVIGMVSGSAQPKEYIIVSAHYDHIGHLGKEVILQGANDNASGVAMLLAMAEYFGKPENRPKKSIIFISFAAEEIGLLGSQHYVKEPVVPLDQTKFVLNLDLMGSGSEGITVVNGEELVYQYELLTNINAEKKYVLEIKKRSNKANSDHYPFTQKEVEAFFVYARGKVGGYHNLGDTVDTLEKNQFDGLFNLAVDFVKKL